MGADNTKAKLLRIIEELSQISANQAEMIDFLKQENAELRTAEKELEKLYQERKELLEQLDGYRYSE